MRDDGRNMCLSCKRPRRVFIVFADRDGKSPGKHDEFEVCSGCVGSGAELVRQPQPTLDGGG